MRNRRSEWGGGFLLALVSRGVRQGDPQKDRRSCPKDRDLKDHHQRTFDFGTSIRQGP
jgi:hypothetical protein